MTDKTPEERAKIEAYRKLVLEYEQLDQEIDMLLTRHDGGTKNMSAEDFSRYRELAARRDEVYSRIQAMENILFKLDDEN